MKRLKIDQKLCDKVMKMRQSGMEAKAIAEILEISRTTISRIEEVYYDAERYKEACEQRQMVEKLKKQGKGPNPHVKIWDDKKTGGVDYSDFEVPGQMKMELPEDWPKGYEEEIKMFMPEGGGTPVQLIDENKMMRFIAGQVDKILKAMDEDTNKRFIATKTDFILDVMQRQNEKLDKIIDTLSQVLRKMDGGK